MKKGWIPILGLASVLALLAYFFYAGQQAPGEISAKPGAPMKLRVLIEQGYGEADIELPFQQLLEEILAPAGVELLGSAATTFDATLTLTVRGRAHGGEYRGPGFLYSGALVSGTISLEEREGPALERDFCRGICPPSMVEGGKHSSEPSSAPFAEALLGGEFGGGGWCDLRSAGPEGAPQEPEPEEPREAFLPALLEIVGETYGYQLLVPVAVRGGIDVSRWGRLSPLRSHRDVRLDATRELKRASDPGVVELLLTALEEVDPEAVANAAYALGELQDPRAVEPLAVVVRGGRPNSDGWTRLRVFPHEMFSALQDTAKVEAATALGQIGDPRAVEPLVEVLQDEPSKVRRAAAQALGTLGAVRALEPLLAALEDESPDVRREAAKALGHIGDPRAVERLVALAEDESDPAHWGASEALYVIADKYRLPSPEDSSGWRRWWERNKHRFQANR
ncbi:MAG: HEAT repeat domain-containing protein [Candidatus Acidoferrales bacterium]